MRWKTSSIVAGFCLLLSTATWALNPILTIQTLQDLRLFITFKPSTSSWLDGYDAAGQADFKLGIEMGLKMWQSILPDLHYRWVDNGLSANITFDVNGDASAYNWAPAATWAGSTSCTIYYFPHSGTHNEQYGAFTGLSRDAAFTKFEPATWPPYQYGNPTYGSAGWQFGRWLHGGSDQNINEGCDLAAITFHEFGHCLGMADNDLRQIPVLVFTDGDFINIYGQPHAPGATKPYPQQPHNNIRAALPTPIADCMVDWPLLTGPGNMGFGGGTCTDSKVLWPGDNNYYDMFNTFGPNSPWISGLESLHPLGQIHNENWTTWANFTGIPPGYSTIFNNRVIYGLDLNPVLYPQYAWTWPATYGMIRLKRPDGSAALANNWYSAISKAQLDAVTQNNPYMMDSIYGECNNLKTVCAGAQFTAAITADGKLYAWGDNSQGELGIGSSGNYKSTPVVTTFTGTVCCRSVACGGASMVILDTGGVLYSCGSNTYGQLGKNSIGGSSTTPALVGNVSGQPCYGNKYVAISMGAAHCLALKDDGTLWAWGYNAGGQVGDGTTANRSVPVKIGTANDWISVYAGAFCSFAINASGALYSWGANSYGQLGLCYASPYVATPTVVMAFRTGVIYQWKCVSNSQNGQTIAVRADGGLYGCGLNDQHQIDGSGTNYTTPTEIGADLDWVSCEAGWDYSMAKKRNGKLYAWGNNTDGIFAGQTVTPYPALVSSAITANIRSYSCGQGHAVALTDDGKLWTWGYNGQGELGRNGTTSSSTVSAVSLRTNGISGTMTDIPSGTINLTQEGAFDWALWGNAASVTPQQKKTGNSMVNFSAVGGVTLTNATQAKTFSWTQDGPTLNHTGTQAKEIRISGSAGTIGVSFTDCAFTGARTLKLYVGVNKATGRVRATLNDGVTADYAPADLSNTTGTTYKVFTIVFSSASPQKNLTVNWTRTSTSGDIRLLAATMR
jgi:alpha-tubulin suppressor-like RCC1 family protein